jgi:hypothetical protein
MIEITEEEYNYLKNYIYELEEKIKLIKKEELNLLQKAD